MEDFQYPSYQTMRYAPKKDSACIGTSHVRFANISTSYFVLLAIWTQHVQHRVKLSTCLYTGALGLQRFVSLLLCAAFLSQSSQALAVPHGWLWEMLLGLQLTSTYPVEPTKTTQQNTRKGFYCWNNHFSLRFWFIATGSNKMLEKWHCEPLCLSRESQKQRAKAGFQLRGKWKDWRVKGI